MASERTVDVARRAKQIYEHELRAVLEPAHADDYVAIEPDSGEHFLGDSLSAAMSAARDAHPDRLVFLLRIGHPTGVHLGEMWV